MDLRLSSSCSCVPWVMVASERAGGGRSTKAAQGRPSGGRATTGERDLDGVSRENERHDHHTLRALTREDYHVEKVRDVAAVVRLPQRWVKKFVRRRQLRRNRGSPPGVFYGVARPHRRSDRRPWHTRTTRGKTQIQQATRSPKWRMTPSAGDIYTRTLRRSERIYTA